MAATTVGTGTTDHTPVGLPSGLRTAPTQAPDNIVLSGAHQLEQGTGAYGGSAKVTATGTGVAFLHGDAFGTFSEHAHGALDTGTSGEFTDDSRGVAAGTAVATAADRAHVAGYDHAELRLAGRAQGHVSDQCTFHAIDDTAVLVTGGTPRGHVSGNAIIFVDDGHPTIAAAGNATVVVRGGNPQIETSENASVHRELP